MAGEAVRRAGELEEKLRGVKEEETDRRLKLEEALAREERARLELQEKLAGMEKAQEISAAMASRKSAFDAAVAAAAAAAAKGSGANSNPPPTTIGTVAYPNVSAPSGTERGEGGGGVRATSENEVPETAGGVGALDQPPTSTEDGEDLAQFDGGEPLEPPPEDWEGSPPGSPPRSSPPSPPPDEEEPPKRKKKKGKKK